MLTHLWDALSTKVNDWEPATLAFERFHQWCWEAECKLNVCCYESGSVSDFCWISRSARRNSSNCVSGSALERCQTCPLRTGFRRYDCGTKCAIFRCINSWKQEANSFGKVFLTWFQSSCNFTIDQLVFTIEQVNKTDFWQELHSVDRCPFLAHNLHSGLNFEISYHMSFVVSFSKSMSLSLYFNGLLSSLVGDLIWGVAVYLVR